LFILLIVSEICNFDINFQKVDRVLISLKGWF
jgi:hypothetical protein